ncbi:DUF1642 domain-containing protein [Streptococcus infantarius]|uniref:DUF1642 domain-containing protein n=1 Tax=Streptococcus infantarius TaxID=102684 RepID=UPI003C19A943
MDKQELIEKLEKDLTMMSEIKGFKYEYDRGYEQAIKEHLAMISDLDWLEKPVVPQFVADFYEENKDDLEYNLYMLCIKFNENKLSADLHAWFNDGNNKCIETLVKMKLYGYEVEKEKLYTVRFSSEFLGNLYIGIRRKTYTVGLSVLPVNDEKTKSWFTEFELKKFNFWENPAFITNKVK